MSERPILALDISTHTGFAVGVPGCKQPTSGVWHLPPMADLGACFAAIENELDDALVLHRPCLVLAEAPLEKQQTTARLLLGLSAHVLSTCWRHNIRCREESVDTMRLAVLGRARFADRVAGKQTNGRVNAKAAVMLWCRQQGWDDVTDDNEGDALLAWTYAARQMRKQRGRAAA